MKVRDRNEAHATFTAEEGDQLVVSYDNRGDPFREGIAIVLHEPGKPWRASVFLDRREALELRNLINNLFSGAK